MGNNALGVVGVNQIANIMTSGRKEGMIQMDDMIRDYYQREAIDLWVAREEEGFGRTLEQARRLMDATSPGAPIHLLGVSMGGIVAARAAVLNTSKGVTDATT